MKGGSNTDSWRAKEYAAAQSDTLVEYVAHYHEALCFEEALSEEALSEENRKNT